MVSILKRINANTIDVVSTKELMIGDEIEVGRTNGGRPILMPIVTIHEQRKERGIYTDESKRRMWAQISY